MASPFLSDISKGADLKHVETADKSAPKIEPDVHISASPMNAVKDELKTEHQLKHVDTNDRSAPVIEKDVHVHENPRPAIMAEIASRAAG